jgi:hypothetical protein
MKAIRRKGSLVITVPLFDEPHRSKTGKSIVVAGSHGLRKSKLKVNGFNIFYSANAFYYPEAWPGLASLEAEKRHNKRDAASRKLRHRQKL